MYVSYPHRGARELPVGNGPSPVGLMLVPSDLRNDGVQDRLPDALGCKDRRPPIVLASSNDGFRPKLPFATRFTNGFCWSTPAAPATTQNATFGLPSRLP